MRLGQLFVISLAAVLFSCTDTPKGNPSSKIEDVFGKPTDNTSEIDTGDSASNFDSDSLTDVADHGSDSARDTQGSPDTTPHDDTDTSLPHLPLDDLDAEICLEQTADLSTCVACCDCSTFLGCEERVTCYEACDTHNFKRNDSFITFDSYETFGASGQYLDCFSRGEEHACKICCDCSTIYACGDLVYCRKVCENLS